LTGRNLTAWTVRAALWLLVYAFLLTYLHPELLVQDTVITGGDTASHYFTAVYLKEYLLPQGKIMGWQPGNYAGFPLFQFYFPLPFLVMVGLSLALPMTVAFKLVTVAGILALPFGAYSLLKNLGLKRPAPDLGAVFVLPFLFMEANSAWGGNIPSTLAGEFGYSIGLALSLIYLGRMFRDIPGGPARPAGERRPVGNALILALVGLSHGYTLLFCVIGAGFFLLTTRNWISRLAYVLEVNLLAFCFMGFWIVPLLLFLPYTTSYNLVWIINNWREALPVILWPYAAIGLAWAGWKLFPGREAADDRERIFFFLFLMAAAGIFYFLANKIGLVDIRFLPFGQIALVLLGAAGAAEAVRRLKARHLAVPALVLFTIAWSAHHERYIEKWVLWNYSGYETKRLWPAFRDLTEFLQGGFDDPRVVYEHGPRTEAVGSLRAFESLPFFSGRATLEGLYLQSSLSAPFVFYLQSEISQACSAPLIQYNYSRFDLERAKSHLELFNVSRYITVTEESRAAAARTEGFNLLRAFPPFAVFEVASRWNRYVVQPRFKPVLVQTDDPQAAAFAWFRRGDLAVPIIMASRVDESEKDRFAAVFDPETFRRRLSDLPRQPLPPPAGLRETVRNEEILIEGAAPGRPLWIKVSYHPNWRVEGADGVRRAGPAFMMVFPDRERVRLYFTRTWPDYLGLALTFVGLVYALVFGRAGSDSRRFDPGRILAVILAPAARLVRPRAEKVTAAALVSAGLLIVVLVLTLGYQDPSVHYRRGMKFYEAGRFDQARAVFRKALAEFPLSPVADQTLHHLALTYFRQEKWTQARTVWQRFETDYPESRLWPEALYHIGLCWRRESNLKEAEKSFTALADRFPDSPWAEEARKRLAELQEAEFSGLFETAQKLFDRGRYREARPIFLSVRDQAGPGGLADRAGYFSAVCLFKEGRWAEALAAFTELAGGNPQGPWTAEARYHLGLIRLHLGQVEAARAELARVIQDHPGTRWSGEAAVVLESLDRGGGS